MMKINSPWSLSFISALLFSVGWPIWGHPILLFFIFIPLFFIEKKINSSLTNNKALKIWAFSYLTFLLWNLATTWWLINASLSGMLIANIFNSFFFSILFLSFHWIKKRLPIRGAYAFFVSIWISFEKLHLSWDISWPWLTLGNGFSEHIYWIQWYEYTGVFGGSLWVLVVNIGLFEVLKSLPANYTSINVLKNSLRWIIAIIVPILISLIIYINIDKSYDKISVLTIQPNIDPYDEKYLYSNLQFLEKFIDQIKIYKNKKIDYIILPETYFAKGFGERLSDFEESQLNQKIKEELIGFEKTQLISGIQFFNTYDDLNRTKSSNKIRENLWADFYNSAISVSTNKKSEFYHKSKLVVGVETLPYSDFIMPLFGEYMINLGGTISNRVIQKNRSIFKHPYKEIRAAPVICYESIYGEFNTEFIRLGADFFAIISNDAWWGDTPGHKQLLSITRLRAIENRRAIARSANTGISALINEKGEYIKTLEYGVKGSILGEIPVVKKITFYSKYGDFIARICFLTLILYFLMALSGRYKS